MKHRKNIAQFIICGLVIIAVVLFILLVTPQAKACGNRKQDALHEAAELLRAVGYTDEDAVIKALSAQWWAEEEGAHIWRQDVPLSAELQAALLKICAEQEVDPLLALGLIETESGFQTDIVSPWGDYGLCQLNRLYFPVDLSPEENMRAGIGLLGNNLKLYGSVEAALTAYNRGHDDGSRYYAGVVLRNAAKWGYEA